MRRPLTALLKLHSPARHRTRRWVLAGIGLLTPALALLAQTITLPEIPADVLEREPILRAMRDELERSKQLSIVGGQDAPYFISYTLTDSNNLTVSSTLGATVNVRRDHLRAPSIEVRVGSYELDNTGHIFSGAYNGSRFDGSWPLDDDYQNLRDGFWLGTDRAFKAALESMARKRATSNNAASPLDVLPDFLPAAPVVSLPEISKETIDEQAWIQRTNRASEVFGQFPDVLSSAVELSLISGSTYLTNSEGTAIHYPDGLTWMRGKAEGQAPDGMLLHDSISVQSLEIRDFPDDAELRAAFTEVGKNVEALTNAPPGEAFVGPTLFEPRAAAQLLAQLLGDSLYVPRRPLTEPGRGVNFVPSQLETRMGARVLPDFFSVIDDPTQVVWQGKPLAGFYSFDLEGVPSEPVQVVENGTLRNFLTTRQPTKSTEASNGHARLPGAYGTRQASYANLFITAEESVPLAELKRQLIEMVTERGQPYGMLVRKLDYPYSGSTGELQALAQANSQGGGGGALPVSPPILIYRVYPDGREELVRGLRFRGVSTRTLRDILAASSESEAFDFVNTTAPLALLGSGGYLAAASVIAPALLFDEIEFEQPQEQLPKPPTVPPPTEP